jgi:hypothetical protein
MRIKSKYTIQAVLRIIAKVGFIISLLLSLISCEKWHETSVASHVSQLPRFEIAGGDFISFVVSDSGEFEDPGAKAYEGETPLTVYSFGEVDLTKVGVYTIAYWAQNSDGLSEIGERIVSVTISDVSKTNLSGKYEGTLWSPPVQMNVEKISDNGLYTCEEVFGYPDTKMAGKFVDLGNSDLVLLHGKGDFGRYAQSEGSYTLSTLSWTISLIDEPYDGTTISVMWRKVK